MSFKQELVNFVRLGKSQPRNFQLSRSWAIAYKQVQYKPVNRMTCLMKNQKDILPAGESQGLQHQREWRRREQGQGTPVCHLLSPVSFVLALAVLPTPHPY